MALQTKGKLHLKYDAQQVTEKFRKREFIMEIQEGNYPEYIKFQLVNDKCNLLDKHQQGEELTVHFNLRGKPFQSKTGETVYFTNLDVWKIDSGSQAQSTVSATSMPVDTSQFNNAPLPTDSDDLPF